MNVVIFRQIEYFLLGRDRHFWTLLDTNFNWIYVVAGDGQNIVIIYVPATRAEREYSLMAKDIYTWSDDAIEKITTNMAHSNPFKSIPEKMASSMSSLSWLQMFPQLSTPHNNSLGDPKSRPIVKT